MSGEPNLGGERLWTVDFVLDLLTAHCLFAAYTAMFTIIPLYVFDRGGVEWQLGIVIGSFGVVGLLIRPFGGRWVYSVGAKWIAIVGTAVFGVASLLHILAPNVWFIIPARALQGVGLALGPVATSTIVVNLAPLRRRAEAMGYMGNSISAASLYSPALAFFIMQQFGFSIAFVYSASMAFAGCVAAVRLSVVRTNVPVQQGPQGYKAPLISRDALLPTLIFLTYTMTTAPVATFLPQVADERGFGNPGLYFTMYSITSMFSLGISGRISDRFGRGSMILPGLLIVAVGMFVLATAELQLLFMSAGVLSGLGFGMVQPSMQSWTVDRVEARERSSALATLQSAWDIGGSGGSFVFGPVGAVTGAAATFAIAGAGTLTGAFGFVASNLLSRRKS